MLTVDKTPTKADLAKLLELCPFTQTFNMDLTVSNYSWPDGETAYASDIAPQRTRKWENLGTRFPEFKLACRIFLTVDRKR